jgi:aminodeoxyfutalosine deaminase
VTFPKIELHVHLEGTVRAGTLLQIARRNGMPLPADSVEGLAELYRFRDFAHFLQTWLVTTRVLQTEQDFRQVVVDYAAEAASHGAVYLEGIFTPAEPVSRGADWDAVFTGYCDGAQQADELHGVHVRLTPDIPRGYPLEVAELTARFAIAYRDRGVVGLGLGGDEAEYPPEPYAPANVRKGVVAALAEHPLPRLVAAGVACSVSTDDPAMFGTDLTFDYAAAMSLGVSARDCYLAGLRGALCDEPTTDQLRQAGEAFDWAGLTTARQV